MGAVCVDQKKSNQSSGFVLISNLGHLVVRLREILSMIYHISHISLALGQRSYGQKYHESCKSIMNAIPVNICHNVAYVDHNKPSSGPFEECWQGWREVSHNSGKHNRSHIIKLCVPKKHKGDPYYTCARGHICMDARFAACVSRPNCLKPQHTDGKRLAAHAKAAVSRLFDWTAACACPRWEKAAVQVQANCVGSAGQARQ